MLGDGSLTLVIDPVELVRTSWKAGALKQFAIRNSQLAIVNRSQAYGFSREDTESAASVVSNPRASTVNNCDARTAKMRELKPSAVTVLVIEDSAVQRQSLVLTLQKAGYQVLQAVNGQEGITQLHQHTEVDLVISDIEMPQMNGFEFLEHCRQNDRLSRIPVVMVTTRSGQKHRQLAQTLGAKAYLTKPYSEQDLLTTVAELSITP